MINSRRSYSHYLATNTVVLTQDLQNSQFLLFCTDNTIGSTRVYIHEEMLAGVDLAKKKIEWSN